MSIVNLVKLTFYGHSDDKQTVIAELQKLGCLHLISLTLDKPAPDYDKLPSNTKEALGFLLQSPRMHHQATDPDDFDAITLEEQVLNIKHQLQTLRDEQDFLQHRINALRPWGDFDFHPLEDMQDIRLWFYRLSHAQIQDIPENITWQTVNKDNRFHYIIVIAEDNGVRCFF
jgi:V/A-type H+/Na+-transporting ATPase subunit I